MITVTEKTIRVNANTSLRTFTIRTEHSKYRTNKMSKEEFMSNENNTANDWKEFLRRTNDYYLVKQKNMNKEFCTYKQALTLKELVK